MHEVNPFVAGLPLVAVYDASLLRQSATAPTQSQRHRPVLGGINSKRSGEGGRGKGSVGIADNARRADFIRAIGSCLYLATRVHSDPGNTATPNEKPQAPTAVAPIPNRCK